jgi:hypothetical protein
LEFNPLWYHCYWKIDALLLENKHFCYQLPALPAPPPWADKSPHSDLADLLGSGPGWGLETSHFQRTIPIHFLYIHTHQATDHGHGARLFYYEYIQLSTDDNGILFVQCLQVSILNSHYLMSDALQTPCKDRRLSTYTSHRVRTHHL